MFLLKKLNQQQKRKRKMTKNKLFIFSLSCSLCLLMVGCSDDKRNSETQKFIDSVKTKTKPNSEEKEISLDNITAVPTTIFTSVKERNPFAVAATPVSESAQKVVSNLTLLGIFRIGSGSNEKKWAIIRSNDKIVKVTAGEAIGDNLITQVADGFVTVERDENGEKTTFTLKMQESK